MDCYISVFQSLSSHIDEITEERKKKKKTTDSKGKREFIVPLSCPNQHFEITLRYRSTFFVLETDSYSYLYEI